MCTGMCCAECTVVINLRRDLKHKKSTQSKNNIISMSLYSAMAGYTKYDKKLPGKVKSQMQSFQFLVSS
jgi:hypothetical protein